MQRYRYFNDSYDWWDAQRHCESLGTSLITIDDAEESQLVNSIMGCEDVDVWIGVFFAYGDERGNNIWRTVCDNAGCEELSFTQWHIGEPHDAYTDCATLTSREGRMGWAATSCWSTAGVICEESEPE